MLDTFRHNRPLYLSNVRRDSTCTTTTNSTFGSLTQRSYSSTYKQAVSIYKAIQFSHPNMLTEECIRKCLFAWENNPGSTVTEISSLMQRLVNTTELDTRKISLDDALVHAYSKNENMATVVCPEFALLVAVHYIHRLKMKYQDVVGAHGCSRRLVMIAFLVAVKYIHSSLRLIVEPSFKSPATTESSFLQSHMKLSTERSTLQASSDTTASSSFQCKSGSRNSHAQKQPFVELIKEYVPESTIERMELEFLHFLNYDLRLSDPMRLVTWAQEQHTSNQQAQYTSGDEAGDEMDDETTDDDE